MPMAELLSGESAHRAIYRLANRNPSVGHIIREVGSFILGLEQVVGLNSQEPPTTYNLAFVLRDRGKGRRGAFVSMMVPSFYETGKWKQAPDSGTVHIRVYVDPSKSFPRWFRWLSDRSDRKTFDLGWVDGYVFADRTNLDDALSEIRTIATGL